MKSLRSIAQQKKMDLKKLEAVVERMDDLIPVKIGKTLLFSTGDAKLIAIKYFELYTGPAQGK